jgi:UDP-glucose 4-epimerase
VPEREVEVLVLGGTGFIGRRIIDRLETQGRIGVHPASRSRTDLRAPKDVERLAASVRPETTLLVCAGVQRFRGDSPDLFRANVEIAAGAVKLAALAGCNRVVFFSSVAVYGESTTNLAISEATPPRPETFYGLSKLASEQIFSGAAAAGGWSVLQLRPALVYGPGNDDVPYRPAAFARELALGSVPVLWGDGTESRDFVHVDDVAEATISLLERGAEGVVVLASGRPSSFRECVATLAAASGRPDMRIPMRERTGPRSDQAFDTSVLRSLLTDFTPRPLAEGLAEVWSATSAAWRSSFPPTGGELRPHS